jgi:small subunit ribosomal protein S17
MSKTRTGVALGNALNKTVRIQVDRMVSHPKYGKRFRVSKKFAAHDETNQTKIGDTVLIMETKPISKNKSWKVVSIVKAGVIESEINDMPTEEGTV